MTSVVADALTVQYRGTSSPQVNSASFALGDGVTALVGKNGAGKTTLLQTIVGLERPRGGHLNVLGHSIQGPPPKAVLARIGYLPQEFGYVPSFTVREFVEYGAWLKAVPSARIPDAASEALRVVDLEERGHIKMRKLSGGMRRRAGIAQAIAHDPDLLILDEPTTGLDPEQRVRFRELIRSLARGRQVLLSSHLIEDVKAVATKLLVMDSGRFVFDGSPGALEALAADDALGDTDLERGYMTVLAENGDAES